MHVKTTRTFQVPSMILLLKMGTQCFWDRTKLLWCKAYNSQDRKKNSFIATHPVHKEDIMIPTCYYRSTRAAQTFAANLKMSIFFFWRLMWQFDTFKFDTHNAIFDNKRNHFRIWHLMPLLKQIGGCQILHGFDYFHLKVRLESL